MQILNNANQMFYDYKQIKKRQHKKRNVLYAFKQIKMTKDAKRQPDSVAI